jgi:mitotic spindle assembly checkpoint protein MAD2B
MALPPATNVLNSYQSLLTTFSDFLIVAIHTILYERAIYPPSTFISTRKYNFPVRQNRHPKVCKWIMDAVAAVEAEMQKGTVNRVAVVIFSQDAKPLQRFMFDVSSFPEVPAEDTLTEFDDGDEGPDGFAEGHNWKGFRVNLVDVEEQLRATMRKLAYCGGKLRPLPEGCTYTVVVELKEQAEPPIGVSSTASLATSPVNAYKHPQPWIPSEPSLQTGEKEWSTRVGSDVGGLKSVPVRLVEAGAFVLEMWIEEGRAKQDDDG